MKRRKQKGLLGRFLLILILVLAVMIYIDVQIRPFMKTMAATQAKSVSNFAISQAVMEEIEDQNTNYSSLVTVNYSGDKVISIESNTSEINALKSKITAAIQNELAEYKTKESSIPLGTLIGGDLFVGRGPKVPLKISLAGNVYTEIESNFSSAGINQTKHEIKLNVKTSIFAMIPGYKASTDVETNLLIAETIIVGDVPEVYGGTNDKSNMVSEFFASTV